MSETTSLRTPGRTQLGIFSNPATETDVAAVTINSRDVEDMKDCKPGDCVVKLPATDMRRIHDEMNWSASPSALQTQLNAYARRRLVEYVTDYRRRGDSAMAIYDDRGNLNVRSSEAFAAQFVESPYIYQMVPSLRDFFATYPHGSLPGGAAEILFWSDYMCVLMTPRQWKKPGFGMLESTNLFPMITALIRELN